MATSTGRLLDLSGSREGPSVQVDAGPAYEFLISLCAFTDPVDAPTLESGPPWFDRIRTQASRKLLQGLGRIGPDAGKMWVNFVGLATLSPAARDVAELLGRIETLSPLDVRRYLLGEHVPAYQGSISRAILRRAAEGDAEAKDRLLADPAYFSGEADPALRPLLALDPDETKAIALDVLRRWDREIFAPSRDEVLPALIRDAEAKRALLQALPAERVIELASGIQFVPKPQIRQVYLIPQLAMRPWVLLCEHDDARLFCYPAADESVGPGGTAPPARLVRLHKALGDERRLRMLKRLATSTATLQELADDFRLPKSTAHHHLAILRAAGLVRVTSDLERRYSVRSDVLPEASGLLQAYLEGSAR